MDYGLLRRGGHQADRPWHKPTPTVAQQDALATPVRKNARGRAGGPWSGANPACNPCMSGRNLGPQRAACRRDQKELSDCEPRLSFWGRARLGPCLPLCPWNAQLPPGVSPFADSCGVSLCARSKADPWKGRSPSRIFLAPSLIVHKYNSAGRAPWERAIFVTGSSTPCIFPPADPPGAPRQAAVSAPLLVA